MPALKQVQLSETTNDKLEAICQKRFENEEHGHKKKSVVSDAIAMLYKKECFSHSRRPSIMRKSELKEIKTI